MRSVQKKSFVRIDPESADTKRLHHPVDRPPAGAQLHGYLVQVGVRATIPQMRIGYLKLLECVSAPDPTPHFRRDGGHWMPISVEDR